METEKLNNKLDTILLGINAIVDTLRFIRVLLIILVIIELITLFILL
jgi:hypothetical protein